MIGSWRKTLHNLPSIKSSSKVLYHTVFPLTLILFYIEKKAAMISFLSNRLYFFRPPDEDDPLLFTGMSIFINSS